MLALVLFIAVTGGDARQRPRPLLAEVAGEHTAQTRAGRQDTRVAPLSWTAVSRPGQSAWSDRTYPRSTAFRRRAPRTRIHPEATASDAGSNFLTHAEPDADGGAITRRSRPPGFRRVRGGLGRRFRPGAWVAG